MIDEKKVLADIDAVVKALDDPQCEYMKGYLDALLAVRGMLSDGGC